MYLGIEIGGSKLQLGIGSGRGGPLAALERFDVDPRRGAQVIREQIRRVGEPLVERHKVSAIGIGFGGPVDVERGRTVKSHHVDGWTDFPLADWCRETFALPAVLANDSDSAGLAEALFGAGRGRRVVFYTNVGTGIGGALVIGGRLYRGGRGMAVEPGHLRPGLQCERADQHLESLASGWAITAAVRARLGDPVSHPIRSITDSDPESVRRQLIEREDSDERDAADLLERCRGRTDELTTKIIAQAANQGNRLAREEFDRAAQAFGWAIAQVITLAAPNIVVLGGGVSLAGEELFVAPVRKYISRYVFPPYADGFEVALSELGEEVVVHGALALADGQ